MRREQILDSSGAGHEHLSMRWIIVAILLLNLPARVHAWDDFGHMEVAAVAYDRLTPAARKRAAKLLEHNPRYLQWIVGAKKSERARVAFIRAATWADAIKGDPQYKKTDKADDQHAPTASQNIGYADRLAHSYWHYIDLPFSPDGTKLEPPVAPNAQTQIAAFRSVLGTPGGDDDVKSYDLAWLLHLVGDVHQPLHRTSRFDQSDLTGDRGANNVSITGNTSPTICDDPRYCPYGPPTELHAFYDDITGASYSVAAVESALVTLPKPKQKDAAISDEASWVQEGFQLAQSAVYVTPIGIGHGPFVVDDAYQRAALTLAKQRISLAGARLANLLNDCFAKEAGSR
jgi:S1/P1 Nuclease